MLGRKAALSMSLGLLFYTYGAGEQTVTCLIATITALWSQGSKCAARHKWRKHTQPSRAIGSSQCLLWVADVAALLVLSLILPVAYMIILAMPHTLCLLPVPMRASAATAYMIILGDCFQPLLEGHFGQVGAD